jgi:cell wall-associated NlpC family hydrolase
VGGVAPGETAAESYAVNDVMEMLGIPYVWGGESPLSGFDCSGLVQYVYREVGISLPRVAQNQFDAGPPVPTGTTVEPGDLVFFGSGPDDVSHVGMYVGDGLMVDAPHTGAVVRFDRIAGSEPIVGVTAPGQG